MGALEELRERVEKMPDLNDENKVFCTDACLNRYLRARNQNVDKAEEQLAGTLAWRREFRPQDLKAGDLVKEAETGKNYTFGSDKEGRPIIWMRPRNENTWDHEGNVKLLVYVLETAIRNMAEGVEKWIVCVDYRGIKMSNQSKMKTSMEILHILQNHYPERLYRGYLCCTPMAFKLFWNVLKPFIDKETHLKIVMITKEEEVTSTLLSVMDAATLETEWNGCRPAFDFAEFWKALSDKDEASHRAADSTSEAPEPSAAEAAGPDDSGAAGGGGDGGDSSDGDGGFEDALGEDPDGTQGPGPDK